MNTTHPLAGLALASALVFAGASAALAQAATDSLGVPGPITFQGEDYALAWTSQPSPVYIKQEYVPAGQQVETFEDMILVEAASGAISPLEAATFQMQSVEARKGSDPVANHQMISNDATGEVLLDFLISDLSADPIIIEWNAYRYVPLAKGEGVALFAISRRGYGEDGAEAFMTGLSAMRNQAINDFVALELPAISFRSE